MAAYADHAAILGHADDAVAAFVHKAWRRSTTLLDLAAMVDLALGCGQANLKVMELLDAANTGPTATPYPPRCPLGQGRARPSWFRP